MRHFAGVRLEYKTVQQVRVMRKAGLITRHMLESVKAAAAPGVTTAELDAVARRTLAREGATSNFLGYEGYPATICASIGAEVVHGIPSPDRRLAEGDVVSIDAGAIVRGWHGDAAITFIVGEGDPTEARLVEVTRQAMWTGVAALARGRHVGDIGDAIDDYIIDAGQQDGREYGIVQEYVGHGIGTQMHMDPDVLNFRSGFAGPRLRPGMCLAVEPLITLGDWRTRTLENGWTAVTVDGSAAAHWENTTAILPDGVWVLTEEDGGAAELGRRGIQLSAVAR